MVQSYLEHSWALVAVGVFVVSYIFVLLEEKFALKKSKPVIIGATLIWAIVAYIVSDSSGDKEALHHAVSETMAEYGGLLLFLLVAMTYIAALQERGVFETLKSRMTHAGLSLRQLFWTTGLCAFCLSPIADNMTTALVMGTIALTLAGDDKKVLTMFMVNIVNAANAGGAFSPFGDITTLMVWQAGKLSFFEFFVLFVPSVVCFLVPSVLMHFLIPKRVPQVAGAVVTMKRGAKRMIALGLFTIVLAISFEQVLHIPSFLGMMLGLGLLLVFGYYLGLDEMRTGDGYDIFSHLHEAEWDTLLFFFGVIFAISGLGFLGYLEMTSSFLYGELGTNAANIVLGLASAVVDNIPLMFAVLQMDPDMSDFEWELITLALGTGGSLLSIGSAAGVALMGISKGNYTFMGHLRWTPLLLAGYVAAIACHFIIGNGGF